jgi:hypothetical protein
MGTFYRMCTADVSCEVRLKDGTYALLKVRTYPRQGSWWTLTTTEKGLWFSCCLDPWGHVCR